MVDGEGTQVRILVVEDEAMVALGIQGWLSRAGYLPAVATSGEEAVRCVVEFQPDLVLMDIKLPGEMDGITAAEEIRIKFDIPVIYLTAHADEATLQRAKVTAAAGYVVKPVEMRELRGAIEMALYKHQSAQKLKESEARYRAITELTSDYAYSIRVEPNGQHITEWVTAAYTRITGFTPEETEICGGWETLIHPEDLPHYHQGIELLKTGQTTVNEYRIINHSQEVRWLRVYGIPILDPTTGKLVKVYGAVKETTERKQSEQALQRRNRELELLNRASQGFNSSLELDEVLANLLEEVRPLLNVAGAAVWLIDPKTGELVCRQASGKKSEQVRGWRLPPGEGIAGWVARQGQNLIIADAQEDDRHFSAIQEQTGLAPRSIFNVPLRVKEQVIGVLQVVDIEPNRFDGFGLKLLESLAATAAIAIENARLYEQTRRDAETRATLLREVNHRVSNNLAAIIGLLSLERNYISPEYREVYESVRQRLVGRVRGLATVHNLLSAAGWTTLYLDELARQIVSSVLHSLPASCPASISVLPSAAVRVNPDQAHHLALILNELATNAVKYAYSPENSSLKIEVSISLENDIVRLEFRDNGPGYPEAVQQFNQYSVGFELIQNLVRHNLRGTLELHNDGGGVALICFKADAGL